MKVLSLSGGGEKALTFLSVIEYIEQQTGKHSQQLFEGFAGTSTGSISALALAKQNPLWAHELVSLYLDKAGVIFPQSIFSKLASVWGLKSDLYPVAGLETLLKQTFGFATMSTLAKPVVITTVDATSKQPVVLTEANKDWSIAEAARASSAGPTFFAPFEKAGKVYCDGGLFANVPDAIAANRWSMVGERHLMLSLGTGRSMGGWQPAELREIGELRWASKVIEMALDLVSAETVQETAGLLGPSNYLRIDPVLPPELTAMDQSDPKKLAALYALGKLEVTCNRTRLDAFISRLVG